MLGKKKDLVRCLLKNRTNEIIDHDRSLFQLVERNLINNLIQLRTS
jgi:hypothetical protein